jgi:hypothetical protein
VAIPERESRLEETDSVKSIKRKKKYDEVDTELERAINNKEKIVVDAIRAIP